MPSRYTKERQPLFDFLQRESDEYSSGRLWTLDPRSIRFKHGESIAELKVPYHLGADDEKIIFQAAQSIATLLKKRFEATTKADATGSGAAFGAMGIGSASTVAGSAGGVEFSRQLQDESMKTSMLSAGTFESSLAREILSEVPLIDGEMLSLWLGQDGYGKKFVDWIKEVMEKAIRDESGVEIGEKTSYLALLSMINTVRKNKDKLRDFKVKGLSFDKFDAATGLTLYVAMRGAIWSLFDKLRESGAQYYNPSYEAVLKTALVSRQFVSIPANVFASQVNPYGIGGDTFKAAHDLAKGALGAASAQEALKLIAEAVRGDKQVSESISSDGECNALRDALMEYLVEFDMANEPKHKLLRDAYRDERSTKLALTDSSAMEKLTAALTETKEKYWKDARRGAAIDKLLARLALFSKGGGVLGWLKSSKKDVPDFTGDAAEALWAVIMDTHADGFVEPMRLHMEDRRAAKYDDKMLFSEYTSGRLYRFSKDNRPILAVLSVDFEGQLFIDMKDFTRKTASVKEVAMSEFMRENFYMPILDAASKYKKVVGTDEGQSGLRVNSLPGDAAVLSGEVEYLVALSHDIHRIVWLYKEKLQKKLPPVKEGFLSDIHKAYGMRKQGFGIKRAELQQAFSSGDKSAEEKLARLALEEIEVEENYRKEIEGAFTSEVEAGLFITYGVKAETTVIPGKPGFCDTVKVAISEKINEAARGTVRIAAVRTKSEMMLENERSIRKNAALLYPFDVLIDTIYSLRLPAEFDHIVESARCKKDDAPCRELATNIARELYADLRTLIGNGTSFKMLAANTDLYNKGHALTREALTAYINETKGRKFFFQKTCHSSALSPKIREKFFLPQPMMEFWFAYDLKAGSESVEVFRRVGEVVFKGMEAVKPTIVFEILNRDGEFVKLLMAEHFKAWLDEVKHKKDDII